MFSTLKKLRRKGKDNIKRKEKKNREKLSTSEKRPSTSGSTFDLCDPDPAQHPARRHSCFPAFPDVPSEKSRRGSIYSRRCSAGSTSSAEGLRIRRLIEISQLDKYIEHLKKSVDSNNISYIPNRLCCVQLLKSVLQRREREYMYDHLHSNRSSSESDISMKSEDSESKLKHGHSVTFSDVNNNNDTTPSHNDNDKPEFTSCLNSKCQGSLSNRLADRTVSDSQESEEEAPEERVPGALLKAYDSDGTQHSAGSDSDSDNSGTYRRRRSSSKTRRRSIALFPQNFEIF